MFHIQYTTQGRPLYAFLYRVAYISIYIYIYGRGYKCIGMETVHLCIGICLWGIWGSFSGWGGGGADGLLFRGTQTHSLYRQGLNLGLSFSPFPSMHTRSNFLLTFSGPGEESALYPVCLNSKMTRGESNSPGFYHFYEQQSMQLSIFWLHSLFLSFSIYFLALGCHYTERERKGARMRTKRENYMNCRTQKLSNPGLL